MSKKFGVDGSFGNSSAIDGNEFIVFSGAEGVDDFGKNFLTNATFTRDEYSEVGIGYPDRCIEGPVEEGRLAYDAETLFDSL